MNRRRKWGIFVIVVGILFFGTRSHEELPPSIDVVSPNNLATIAVTYASYNGPGIQFQYDDRYKIVSDKPGSVASIDSGRLSTALPMSRQIAWDVWVSSGSARDQSAIAWRRLNNRTDPNTRYRESSQTVAGQEALVFVNETETERTAFWRSGKYWYDISLTGADTNALAKEFTQVTSSVTIKAHE